MVDRADTAPKSSAWVRSRAVATAGLQGTGAVAEGVTCEHIHKCNDLIIVSIIGTSGIRRCTRGIVPPTA